MFPLAGSQGKALDRLLFSYASAVQSDISGGFAPQGAKALSYP